MKQDIEFINFGKMIARKEKQVKELTWFIYLKYITKFNMRKKDYSAAEKPRTIKLLVKTALPIYSCLIELFLKNMILNPVY